MEALLAAIMVGVITILAVYIYMKLVLKPKKLRMKLELQGIRGPKPTSILMGNIPQIIQMKSNVIIPSSDKSSHIHHDWPFTIFPHLREWQLTYGPVFTYSTGSILILCVTDPNVMKEINQCSSIDLGKPPYLSEERGPLLGQGIISSSGSVWSFQRKIISPEFFPEKVKGMVSLMVEAATSMLSSWEDSLTKSGGTAAITIDEDLRNMSADIISKTAFGSSYIQGKEIFSKIRELQKLMSKALLVGIPFARYMPTKNNWEIKRLEKKIHLMILGVVKDRMGAEGEKDFLQKILESARKCNEQDENLKIDHERLIVDNCKNIYFAGHETAATTAAWSLMLLAAFPDWQTRARAEVLKACADGNVTAESLRHMKVLTMIIQETLRLYPPGVFAARTPLEDAKLKDIQVPKGIDIQIPIALVHHDPNLWGADASEFNPERFANGIAGACKTPQAYIPFGLGSRVCLGQNFAMAELKVILSLILLKFSFSLSPDYQHSPAFRLLIEPEHGLTMIIQETLRLYPPGVFASRTALEDAKLKDIQVPKGIDVQIPIALVQQDPDLWGADASEFNPERFANGISGACKTPQAYIPFGLGSRVCLGQNFAMAELKVILSLILVKFSFSLSPDYQHSPAFRLLIEPEHGVKLLLRRL
ncbi:hypothetical protein RDABS01_008515 [Bienertia sinuspersici]